VTIREPAGDNGHGRCAASVVELMAAIASLTILSSHRDPSYHLFTSQGRRHGGQYDNVDHDWTYKTRNLSAPPAPWGSPTYSILGCTYCIISIIPAYTESQMRQKKNPTTCAIKARRTFAAVARTHPHSLYAHVSRTM